MMSSCFSSLCGTREKMTEANSLPRMANTGAVANGAGRLLRGWRHPSNPRSLARTGMKRRRFGIDQTVNHFHKWIMSKVGALEPDKPD